MSHCPNCKANCPRNCLSHQCAARCEDCKKRDARNAWIQAGLVFLLFLLLFLIE